METVLPELLAAFGGAFLGVMVSGAVQAARAPRPVYAAEPELALKPLPLEEPTPHVHHWQVRSSEWTNGKRVHVMVCSDHEQPMIERREVLEG